MLGTGYFLKIAKVNSQQEKPSCPNRKNQFPQNTKNRQSAKINSRKNFVPHGMYFVVAQKLCLRKRRITDMLHIVRGNKKTLTPINIQPVPGRLDSRAQAENKASNKYADDTSIVSPVWKEQDNSLDIVRTFMEWSEKNCMSSIANNERSQLSERKSVRM